MFKCPRNSIIIIQKKKTMNPEDTVSEESLSELKERLAEEIKYITDKKEIKSLLGQLTSKRHQNFTSKKEILTSKKVDYKLSEAQPLLKKKRKHSKRKEKKKQQEKKMKHIFGIVEEEKKEEQKTEEVIQPIVDPERGSSVFSSKNSSTLDNFIDNQFNN
jgi:hypothetical protein